MESASPFHILIVGYGEIARLAHLPVLQSRSDALAVGLVDTNFTEEEVVSAEDIISDGQAPSPPLPLKFSTVDDAFRYFRGNIHALSICTPKTATLSVAQAVINIAASSKQSKLLGILLEKPPGEDVDDLKQISKLGISNGISMFTACHTTMCPARKVVDSWLFADANSTQGECKEIISIANNAISRRKLDSIQIIWKENVRKWHPGQAWISTLSGGGVTDMLFNPLSLVVSLFDLNVSKLPTTDNDGKDDVELNNQNRATIRVTKADLVRPSNWEAPISGKAELLMTVPLNDGANGIVDMEVPISADFAFDYEPPFDKECNKAEEIWNVEFVESSSGSNGGNRSSLTIKDGGAQAYIDSRRVTAKPTEEYALRPEYDALYDQFFDLIRRNRSRDGAAEEVPSVVDSTTMAILVEILRLGKCSEGPTFDF